MAKIRARKELKERACVHCGHILDPYMIICDRCGSIQRRVIPGGEKLPPDVFGICEVCGQPVPAGETLCSECASEEELEPIVIEPPKMSTRKSRRIAWSGAIASCAGIAAGIIGTSIFSSTTAIAFGALLGAASLGLIFSLGWQIVLARRPSDQIVIYHSIYKSEDVKSEISQEETDLIH
ncbi:MAG: zinc ribbon domain-containing protein [Actinomycetota bacterium]|nr:zinc ribbon domain-containing protein [Actinomycetota bacterium]